MWTGMKYSALPEYDLYEPSGKELALTCNFWKCAGELRHTWPLSNQKKCQPFLLVSSGTRGRSPTKKSVNPSLCVAFLGQICFEAWKEESWAKPNCIRHA